MAMSLHKFLKKIGYAPHALAGNIDVLTENLESRRLGDDKMIIVPTELVPEEMEFSYGADKDSFIMYLPLPRALALPNRLNVLGEQYKKDKQRARQRARQRDDKP